MRKYFKNSNTLIKQIMITVFYTISIADYCELHRGQKSNYFGKKDFIVLIKQILFFHETDIIYAKKQ